MKMKNKMAMDPNEMMENEAPAADNPMEEKAEMMKPVKKHSGRPAKAAEKMKSVEDLRKAYSKKFGMKK